MSIPAVDESVIEQLMRKFDTDDDRMLSLSDFNRFYQRLLMTVRDHYGRFKIQRK
jgi:hypothetical protein